MDVHAILERSETAAPKVGLWVPNRSGPRSTGSAPYCSRAVGPYLNWAHGNLRQQGEGVICTVLRLLQWGKFPRDRPETSR
eukprot:3266019-Pyramimonas_sp.AAC.1